MALNSSVMREYKRVLKTVLKRIEKLQSEGYIIPERMIPKEKQSPNRIREEIKRLKKYKERYIKESRGVKYKTREGEIVKGKEGAKIQRSESAKKGWRERKSSRVNMLLGEACYDAIEIEAKESLQEAESDGDVNRKWRCLDILDALHSEDLDTMYKRLASVNKTYAVERTQIACKYTSASSYGEIMVAHMEIIQIITNEVISMSEMESRYEEKEYEEYANYEY